MPLIPLIKPVIGKEEEDLVLEVLRSGWLAEGKFARQFEEEFAEFVGARRAVVSTSCTAAMTMSLKAMRIGKGKRVAVSDFTHPATPLAAIAVGASPVLVDVELETRNVNLHALLPELKRRRIDAVIPVSWGGMPLDPSGVREVEESGLLVLEDSACSVGAEYDGVKTGSMSQISVFSFHPRKLIATGEGGMITTMRDDYAEKLQSLKNFGEVKGSFKEFGYNFHMSDILAAVGLAQLRKLPQIIERRIQLAEHYDKLLYEANQELGDLKFLPPSNPSSTVKHTYQSYTVYLEHGRRDRILEELRAKGIGAQIGTYALHQQPYYRSLPRIGRLKNSALLGDRLLTLPMSHNMTSEDQEFVVSALKEAT